VITIPSGPLNVAEACSGIRSLLTLVTLAIIYGYLMERRIWVRVILACSAVRSPWPPMSFAFLAQPLVTQYGDPALAEGFYHALGGWAIFVVALIMLFAVHRVITLIWKDGAEVKPA